MKTHIEANRYILGNVSAKGGVIAVLDGLLGNGFSRSVQFQ